MPHHGRTNNQKKENWTYALEDQGETSTKIVPPPTSEYHPGPPLNMTTLFFSNANLQRQNFDQEFLTMHQEIISLCEELTDLALQIEVSNVTHVEETDNMYHEI